MRAHVGHAAARRARGRARRRARPGRRLRRPRSSTRASPTSCSTRSSASPACEATLWALEHGVTLALANKESLVAAGELAVAAHRRGGGLLLPVDSEHSALFQCLEGRDPETVEALVLTASGGPFRGRSRGRARARHRRGRARPSDLVDGTKDHRRLRHARQQGPRADRGPLAVRHPVRPDRGRRASDVDRPLARPLPRRRAARAPRPARHARADLVRAHATRSAPPSRRRRSTSPPGSTSGSRLPTTRRSRCCRSRARPASAAARSRAPTTPPTRSPWRRSSTGGSGSPRSPTPSPTRSSSVDGAPARDLDDLVAADAEARRVAERRLVPA